MAAGAALRSVSLRPDGGVLIAVTDSSPVELFTTQYAIALHSLCSNVVSSMTNRWGTANWGITYCAFRRWVSGSETNGYHSISPVFFGHALLWWKKWDKAKWSAEHDWIAVAKWRSFLPRSLVHVVSRAVLFPRLWGTPWTRREIALAACGSTELKHYVRKFRDNARAQYQEELSSGRVVWRTSSLPFAAVCRYQFHVYGNFLASPWTLKSHVPVPSQLAPKAICSWPNSSLHALLALQQWSLACLAYVVMPMFGASCVEHILREASSKCYGVPQRVSSNRPSSNLVKKKQLWLYDFHSVARCAHKRHHCLNTSTTEFVKCVSVGRTMTCGLLDLRNIVKFVHFTSSMVNLGMSHPCEKFYNVTYTYIGSQKQSVRELTLHTRFRYQRTHSNIYIFGTSSSTWNVNFGAGWFHPWTPEFDKFDTVRVRWRWSELLVRVLSVSHFSSALRRLASTNGRQREVLVTLWSQDGDQLAVLWIN